MENCNENQVKSEYGNREYRQGGAEADWRVLPLSQRKNGGQ